MTTPRCCDVCGAPLAERRRADTKACSDRCRKRRQRGQIAPRSVRLANRWGLKPGDFWRTPPEIVAARGPFTMDAFAAGPDDAVAPAWLSPLDDALLVPWGPEGGRVWWNPAYSLGILGVLVKALREAERGVSSVGLVPVDTSTEWWALACRRARELEAIKGRVSFLHPDTGRPVHGTRFDSVLIHIEPGYSGPAVHTQVSLRVLRAEGLRALGEPVPKRLEAA